MDKREENLIVIEKKAVEAYKKYNIAYMDDATMPNDLVDYADNTIHALQAWVVNLKAKCEMLEGENREFFKIFKGQIEMFEQTEPDENGNNTAIVSNKVMTELKDALIKRGYGF